MTSFNLHYLFTGPISKTVALGFRASKHEFREGNNLAHTRGKGVKVWQSDRPGLGNFTF